MNEWLTNYLMEHGILKNADAEVMAKEIEERFADDFCPASKLFQALQERDRLQRENAQLAASCVEKDAALNTLIIKAPGYDWNADPDALTLMLGRALCHEHRATLRDLLAPAEQCIEKCGAMLRALGQPEQADVCAAELARLRAVTANDLFQHLNS